MKRKPIIVFIGTISAIGFICAVLATCVVLLWLENRTKSTMELLWPLTALERQCVKQIVGNGKLIYVERQADSNFAAAGYLVNKDYHVSVFSTDQSGHCNVEFQENVWQLAPFGDGTPYSREYELRPRKIQRVELTGNYPLEIYVWFDLLGPGKRTNAKHIFYVKQADGTSIAALTLQLCLGSSSVRIDRSLQRILATDDMQCDWPSGDKEYIEYSLSNGIPHRISDCISGEFGGGCQ
jgi:hypothetical protein